MTPQAHLIGQDYSVYYDLIVIVAVLFLCMVVCTLWLVRQKRSAQFLCLVWAGFLAVILLGSLGLAASIHSQRLAWRDSCSRMVGTYAHIVGKLDHDKIQPGHPDLFSDWSPPSDSGSVNTPANVPVNASGRTLATPDGLSVHWQDFVPDSERPLHLERRNQWAVAKLTEDSEAYSRCTKHVRVEWQSVPDATVYRLQWKKAESEESEWMTVYAGSKNDCTLSVPDNINLVFRVRAEDGTPEDDSRFCMVVDTLDYPNRAYYYVGYAYTIRKVDAEHFQFIAPPISDANHNGFIDADERPNDIGEHYRTTDILFQYVFNNRVRAMSFNESSDQWGKWFTIAEPLWTPNGDMDGIMAIDFDVKLVQGKMRREQFYPLCLFVLVTCTYFGMVLFISRLQIKARTIHRLATELQGTVLKLTEAQKVTEQALQAKTLFLTNMSHEFRTPLNAMLGFTEIIAMRSSQCNEEEQGVCAEAVRQMRENGNSLLELVENILSVAAMDDHQTLRLKIVPVHLYGLITDIADMLRSRSESRELTLSVEEPSQEVSESPPEWINSDPAHIRQVLIQLIGNAIKFTRQGGISIRYGLSSEPDMVFISVSDTGIGIDEEHLKSIFKPFSQSDPTLTRTYGGTGIGLSVAQQSAEIVNGRILVESQPGQGSTFTFIFPGPAADTPPESPRVQSAIMLLGTKSPKTSVDKTSVEQPSEDGGTTLLPLAGCRVLYVEDTKVNQIVMTKQLEKAGAAIEVADNGQIGIEKIAEAEMQGKPFDIILMDMQMPVLDGYEATRHLRADGFYKPIIAVTAHALTGDREKTLEAGCNEYTSKPVDFKRLTEMINTFWKTR